MADTGESSKLNWPRWQQLLLIALLLLLIGTRLTMQVNSAAHWAGWFGEVAFTEGTLVRDPEAPAGFDKVESMEPNGVLAKAGIRNGDFVKLDESFGANRPHVVGRWEVAGDEVKFTLDRGGIRSEYQIILQPVPAGHKQRYENNPYLVNQLAVIVSILVGCFVLWRGWGNRTAMLLGAALVALGRGQGHLAAWVSNTVLENSMWWLNGVLVAFSALLIPFAIRLFEQQAGSLPRWHWRLAAVWFVWCVVGNTALASDTLGGTSLMTWAGGRGFQPLVQSISLLVALAYLVAGWRRASASERSRFALIIFALIAYLCSAVLFAVLFILFAVDFRAGEGLWLFYLNAPMQGLVAPGLLAYAMLRHKLFDLGFAVNRTLVFGTVSAVLLVGIGLTEYAVKSLLPKVWTQGSVFISAGLAVGVFLIFHRIHHSVEHAIERLFFHKWQVNEAALKRFVAAAGHMEQPEALAGNFVAELVRFTGGATAALYTRTAEGHYAIATGETIDADDPALAAMRAEQGAVVPAELGSPLQAALALPMMHQAALAGFILLGPKPTSEDYRPDEIEVLGWATQQVGLDMQAIRVRDLELTNIRLVERNQTLAEIVENAALAGASQKAH